MQIKQRSGLYVGWGRIRTYIVVFLCIAAGIYTMFKISSREMYKVYIEPMVYKECPPEEIIHEIEIKCGLLIPWDVNNILAAKNFRDSWDGYERDSILRFSMKSSQLPEFIKSLPSTFRQTICQKDYKLEDDNRGPTVKKQPSWFLEPINKGIIIDEIDGGEGGFVETIYIDTSDMNSVLVYIKVIYTRH